MTESTHWLTPEQAAQYLGLSLDTMYKACATGGLKHVKINGKRNIRTKAVWCDEWMERHGIVENDDTDYVPQRRRGRVDRQSETNEAYQAQA